MIETTVNTVDGVMFYENIRLLEPDETIGGMGIHWIPDRVVRDEPELIRAIRALGLKRVGFDYCRDSFEYAHFPMPYIPIRLVQFSLRVYWKTLRWVYDNARVFKQIPANECFSWRYFTPYVWYRGISKGK